MKRVFIWVLVLAVVFACPMGMVLAQVPAKPDWKEGFRAHDRNGNGTIDRAEFQEWMVDVFFKKDTNHKGYLVFEDVKDVMTVETFKANDKNGDGRLTLEEFLNAAFQDFGLADVNKSGTVTIEEIDAYVKRAGK